MIFVALRKKLKYLDSGGSMVARLKLKGIDGHSEDWQIESSFLILWVVVHGRF